MNKSLIVVLALLLVCSFAGTAFAAANPFVDVPKSHWAYDAVKKLAQDGIITGDTTDRL
ncbi:MAG: S-layer protein, partial [Firmicutes bacterium]|nr:S-layer protein [Bacillota bacterium]